MELFLTEVAEVLAPGNLLLMVISAIIGVIIGAIPGLTVNMAVALAVPFTIYMPRAPSLILLLALYTSGVYGGSISAILINTPGTPAAAATTLDGYVLAKQGKAGKALKMALYSSFYGGMFSTFVLILVASQLAAFALKFGPAERTTLLFFALTLVGLLAGESMLRGLLAGSLGLMLATVGSDPMLALPRFTFGILDLEDGFSYIPLLIGLFAISEMLVQAEDRMRGVMRAEYRKSARREDSRVTREDIRESWKSIIRSGFLGTFIGIMPGIGAAVACFFGYGEAKRASKNPEKFGRGTVEGVAAAESANNAVTGATLIPLLALSIPGDTVTAILYGAFLIQGVTVGPLIFQQHLDVVYIVYFTLIVANLVMLGLGLAFLPMFVRVTEIPRSILYPIVLVLCVVGSYAIRNNMFDVGVMLGFGVLGYVLRRLRIPVAPLLIAFILTGPFEEALRQSLVRSEGSLAVFFTRPIALAFIVLTALSLFVTIRRSVRAKEALPQEV